VRTYHALATGGRGKGSGKYPPEHMVRKRVNTEGKGSSANGEEAAKAPFRKRIDALRRSAKLPNGGHRCVGLNARKKKN